MPLDDTAAFGINNCSLHCGATRDCDCTIGYDIVKDNGVEGRPKLGVFAVKSLVDTACCLAAGRNPVDREPADSVGTAAADP